MRFKLEHLQPELHRALSARLEAAGHQLTSEAADGLVVGLGPDEGSKRVMDLSLDDWEHLISRARSAFASVREVAAGLITRRSGGRIVIVVEAFSERVAAGMAGSAVPGAFMSTIGRVAAVELGPQGIAVNTVAAMTLRPGGEALVAGVPLARACDPDEIAAVCEYLLSSESSFVNGATVVVDGGYSVTKTAGGNPLLVGSGPAAPGTVVT